MLRSGKNQIMQKKCNHALTCLQVLGTGWYVMVIHGAGTVSVPLLDLVELESCVNEQR